MPHTPLHLFAQGRGPVAGMHHSERAQIARTSEHQHEIGAGHDPVHVMLVLLTKAVVHTHSLLEELMDRTAELETQLNTLQAAVTEATTRVANDLGSLHAELQSLQNATAPEVDLSGVLTHVAAIKQQVDSIDPTNPPPVDDSPAEEGAESPEQEAAEEPGGEEPAAGAAPPADSAGTAPAGDVPGDPTQAAPSEPGSAPPA